MCITYSRYPYNKLWRLLECLNIFIIEVNRPSTKQLLNNFWGDFLEKLKQFSGRGSKMDCLYKKGVIDQIKIIDTKIKVNQAQYDLDRLAAKISAYCFPDDLRKYEYLTGENLGYKPSVLEQTKFDYSPLSNIFRVIFLLRIGLI